MSATLDYGCNPFTVGKGLTKRKVWTFSQKKPKTIWEIAGPESARHLDRRAVVPESNEQFFRDFPNCYYCGTRLNRDNRSLDHFIPRSRGGSSHRSNLVTACKDCNSRKGNLLPDEVVS